MKSITVAQLRQNPTDALREVEAGESYTVTKHNRAVAHLVPVDERSRLRIHPAITRGRADLSDLEPWEPATAEDLDELIADVRSDR